MGSERDFPSGLSFARLCWPDPAKDISNAKLADHLRNLLAFQGNGLQRAE